MSAGGGIPKRLGQVKRLVIVIVAAAVVAAVLTAVLVATGLAEAVPEVELQSVNMVLAPWFALFLVLFVHLDFAGTMYVFFAAKIVTKAGQARDQWGNLPDAGKALVAGLPYALVAAAAVVLTDFLWYSVSSGVRLAVPVAVWLAVAVAAMNHLREAETLHGIVRLLTIGAAAGIGFAAATLLLRRVVDSISIPGYAPLAALLVGAPLTAIVLARSARRERGYLETILIKTGFAQTRRIQAVTVALGIGLLIAVVGALFVSVTLGGIIPIVLAFLLLWGGSTYGVLQWFQRTDVTLSDLVIVDVRARSSGRRRELEIMNQRDVRVDLREAKIRDTAFDLYRTNIDVILAPGQTETFDIPPDFQLVPQRDDLSTDLPMGFSLSKRAEAPVIVTRNGEKFKLRWREGLGEPSGEAEPDQRQQRTREAERREDRA
ncbi:MAG: hypothetical protein V5A43_06480 [Haloarculaceae archaeon]